MGFKNIKKLKTYTIDDEHVEPIWFMLGFVFS